MAGKLAEKASGTRLAALGLHRLVSARSTWTDSREDAEVPLRAAKSMAWL